ncbi:MAG: phosphate-starvation-inducible PsiE family protein [Proteobacteria bacterium]|nr:phosphate-starvation-inducible PsiE family protein [Pseudomonadota bacterium]
MFEQKLITHMKNFNQFIHVLLAFALGIACVMVIWDFGARALDAWNAGNATSGFFHALGSLFILWTLSTLISAEMSYLLTGRTSVRVFVEVAMISVIREMIVQPVQVISSPGGHDASFSPLHYSLLLVALLVIGIVYKLVSSSGQNDTVTTENK